jgi:hypothetical protein
MNVLLEKYETIENGAEFNRSAHLSERRRHEPLQLHHSVAQHALTSLMEFGSKFTLPVFRRRR